MSSAGNTTTTNGKQQLPKVGKFKFGFSKPKKTTRTSEEGSTTITHTDTTGVTDTSEDNHSEVDQFNSSVPTTSSGNHESKTPGFRFGLPKTSGSTQGSKKSGFKFGLPKASSGTQGSKKSGFKFALPKLHPPSLKMAQTSDTHVGQSTSTAATDSGSSEVRAA